MLHFPPSQNPSTTIPQDASVRDARRPGNKGGPEDFHSRVARKNLRAPSRGAGRRGGGTGKRLASGVGGPRNSIRKEISAVWKKTRRTSEETDRGDKREKEERSGAEQSGADGRTDGRTDGQTDTREGMKIITPRVAPWAISVSAEGRRAGRKKRALNLSYVSLTHPLLLTLPPSLPLPSPLILFPPSTRRGARIISVEGVWKIERRFGFFAGRGRFPPSPPPPPPTLSPFVRQPSLFT